MSSSHIQGKCDTETEITQHGTEEDLLDFYSRRLAPELQRRNHASYLKRNALAFPCASQGLHCSQPWLVYWTIQAADVLGLMGELFAIAPPKALADRVLGCYVVEGLVEVPHIINNNNNNTDDSEKITRKEKFGGFGGGQGQLPHLAASYAAIMSLAIISQRHPEVVDLLMNERDDNSNNSGGEGGSSSSSIRREISNWMNTLFIPTSQPNSSSGNDDDDDIAAAPTPTVSSVMEGSFRMHTGGESDIRASFTVAAITSLLQFPTSWTAPYINPTSVAFVNRCFTFEGGVACSPLSPEAHGGYVSLGLTALVLWDEHRKHSSSSSSSGGGESSPSLHNLGRWISARQCTWEGGFNGRTNKLVDSCYSFWVGAAVVLYEGLRSQQSLHQLQSSITTSSCTPPSNFNIIDELRLEYLALPTLHSTPTPTSSSHSSSAKAVLEAGAETSVDEMMITDAFLSGLAPQLPSGGGGGGEEVDSTATTTISSPAIMTTTTVRDVCEPIREHQQQQNHAAGGVEDGDTDASEAAAFQPPHGDPWGFHTLANQRRLQEYVFKFCQNSQRGGLMDKPYCPNDSYHTCYSLSGTSCMQEGYIRERQTLPSSQSQSSQQYRNPPTSEEGDDEADRDGIPSLSKGVVAELLEGWDAAGAGWGTFLPRTDWETANLKKLNLTVSGEGGTDDSLFADDLGVLNTTNPLYNLRPQHVARFHTAANRK